uniref:AEC family transporter n=1 Tax=Fusobacterium mortiferum TaxID=850 RepID=UPI003FEED766
MEMNIRILIETMFLLLLLIITGYIVSKIHILTEETTKKLSELIVRVTCPALIIGAVFKQDEVGDKGVNILSILGLGVILYLSYILIATIVVKFFKLKNNEKPIYELMLIFSNTSFVG